MLCCVVGVLYRILLCVLDFVSEARVIFRYELEQRGLTTGALYVAAHDIEAHTAAAAPSGAAFSPVNSSCSYV